MYSSSIIRKTALSLSVAFDIKDFITVLKKYSRTAIHELTKQERVFPFVV